MTDDVVQSMLDDLAAGKAVPTVGEFAASSPEPTPIRQRRQRSDAGMPRGPRNVPIDPAGATEALPRRTRRTAGKLPAPEPLKKEDISKLLLSAHTVAGTVISPKAKITKEQADEIAAAFVPVAEDFGIAVASKIVHLILLVGTIVMVEGPVAMDVMIDLNTKRQAARARNVTQVVGGSTTPPAKNEPKISPFGTEIGTPLTAVG